MLSSIFHNPLSLLAAEESPMARDPEWASQELTGLERNRSLYQSMGLPEAVQITETKIQALFRPFDREKYFLKVAAIGRDLHSPDERSFLAALDQARQLPGEYAPRFLRGIALDLRKEADEISRTRRRHELSMKALEAVASVEIEALHQQGRPQSAYHLGNELREILDRIGQGLQSGQTLLEAVNAERSANPVSPFIEMYLERGLGTLVTALSQPGLDDWDFKNQLLDYAETLERGQGLYSGARILAESLVDSTGEIHQRAYEILNRIPQEEEIDGRYRFVLNLLLVTADSNRSVLKLGATAMSFAAAGGLAAAAESGAATFLTSTGASEATALLGSSLAHTLTIGAVQPLLAPGAEHLTWNSYIEQFVHMSGLTGVLGIRGALMRNVASPLAHYASTIGAMTAYDYATQPEIRPLPFALNLANVVGNDLLMRSGETLATQRLPHIYISDLQVPEIGNLSTQGIALASSVFLLGGCEIHNSLSASLVAWLGSGLGLLAMAKTPKRNPEVLARRLRSSQPEETEKGLEEIRHLIASDSLKDNEFAFEVLRISHKMENPSPSFHSVAQEIHQLFLNAEDPETIMVLLTNIGELPDTVIPNLRDSLIPLLDHESEEVAKTTFEILMTMGELFILPRTKQFTVAVREAHDRFPQLFTSPDERMSGSDIMDVDWLLRLSSYLDDESSDELLRSVECADYKSDTLDFIDLDFPWRPAEIEFLNNFKLKLSNLDFFTPTLRSIPLTKNTIGQVQAIFTTMWNELNVDEDGYIINRISNGEFSSETSPIGQYADLPEGEDLIYFQDVALIFSAILSNTRTSPENFEGLRRLFFNSLNKIDPNNLRFLIGFSQKIELLPGANGIDSLEFRSRFRSIFGVRPSSRSSIEAQYPDSERLPALFGEALAFAERIYLYGIQSASYRNPDPSTRQALLGPTSENYSFRETLEEALIEIADDLSLDKHLENLLGQLEFGSQARDKIRLTNTDDEASDQGFVESVLNRFSLNKGLTRRSRRMLANFAANAPTVPASTRQTIFSNLFPEFEEILKNAQGNLEEAWLKWTQHDATLPE